MFTFEETSVISRVGVSFISVDQACHNVDAEIPEGTSLEEIRKETRDVWNSQVFSKVTTMETNVTRLNQLYSALYFMHLIPTNKTGENPLWESNEPYYDDIVTFWDTVSLKIRLRVYIESLLTFSQPVPKLDTSLPHFAAQAL